MAALITKRFRNATGQSIILARERRERGERGRGGRGEGMRKGGNVERRIAVEDGQERETTGPEGRPLRCIIHGL